MTREEKYKLADWTVKFAIENGAQQAKAVINESQGSNIEVRNSKIDKLEQSTQRGLLIALYVDNKYSTHHTNRLDREELKRFINQAIEATRYLSEDEFRKLPDPELYFKGSEKDLKIYDREYLSIDPKEKVKAVFDVEKQILGKDERIISATASYYDGMNSSLMVTSNGFEGYNINTFYGLYASVSIDGGDARPSSGWGESSLFYSDLKKQGIGEKALKRGLDKIGQGKIGSARLPMIIENLSASRSIGPLIAALSGGDIQQKNSFLIGKLGEKIASEHLSIVDDPFLESGYGSRLFDGEGLALKKRKIIDKGILQNYYIDTYYGKKLEMKPTTGSVSNLIVEPGKRSLDEMIAGLDKAILVTGFNGGNTNQSTGDFSYGIEGFLIEKGKISRPVSEMNITGNILTLFENLKEVGNDVYKQSAWRVPSLVFDKVDFSGL